MQAHNNYCTSYIQTSSTERYMYYCKNRDSGVIYGRIYYRKAALAGGQWIWGSQSIALEPSSSGWDSINNLL